MLSKRKDVVSFLHVILNTNFLSLFYLENQFTFSNEAHRFNVSFIFVGEISCFSGAFMFLIQTEPAVFYSGESTEIFKALKILTIVKVNPLLILFCEIIPSKTPK